MNYKEVKDELAFILTEFRITGACSDKERAYYILKKAVKFGIIEITLKGEKIEL